MKQFVLSIAILAIISFTGLSLNAKGIVKQTESFTILTNDAITFESNFDKSWVVEYGDQNKSITIYKRSITDGEEYIVRNNYFEVRYTNTSKGFSAKTVKRSDSKVNQVINQAVINQEQLSQQSLLSSQKLSEEKALGYIAGFVPNLLNEDYKHILN